MPDVSTIEKLMVDADKPVDILGVEIVICFSLLKSESL